MLTEQLLINKYQSQGTLMAGELVLDPDIAIQLLNDIIAESKIIVLGVNVWEKFDNKLRELNISLDLSNELDHINGYTKAKKFIINVNTTTKDLVFFSFVLEDFLKEVLVEVTVTKNYMKTLTVPIELHKSEYVEYIKDNYDYMLDDLSFYLVQTNRDIVVKVKDIE